MKRANQDTDIQMSRVDAKRPKLDALDLLTLDIEKDVKPRAKLSDSQSVALAAVLKGKSIFVTGGAGTGKSFLIDRITEELEKQGKSFFKCAPTGSAAYNIGGTTIYSYAGIGLGEATMDKTIKDLEKYGRDKINRWLTTDVLIIDELSMVEPAFFEKISELAKILRKRPKLPFGGIQLVMTGDAYQLCSPSKKNPLIKYAFQTETWKALEPVMVKLDVNFRQREDERFRNLLNSVRIGNLSKEEYELLASRDLTRLPDVTEEEKKKMTKLFSYRKDVHEANNTALLEIDSPLRSFEAEVYLCAALRKKQEMMSPEQLAKSKFSYPVETTLELKVGASVLLCQNLSVSDGLFNGSKGMVTGFYDPAKSKALTDIEVTDFIARKKLVYPIVQFDNGQKRSIAPYTWKQQEGQVLVSSFTQFPLMLAYGATIHRAQGLTLTSTLVNMKCFFESGQAYVALSRSPTLESLHLTNFIGNQHIKQQIKADPIVMKFYEDNDLL